MTSGNQTIAVVDFGSVIARVLVVEDNKQARVIAYEYEPSQGIQHGVIVDLDKATETIQRLMNKVRKKMDQRVYRVYCSISGDSISSVSSHGVVKIRNQEVNHYDLEDLAATAQAIALDNQLVIHLLPQQYKVDNQEGVKDPMGMYGVRLEGDFHLVLADQGVSQNLVRCLDRAGLTCQGLVFSPIGLAEAVLSTDEKQQGVVVVDIGEGCTNFSMFFNGVAIFSQSIPIGGGAVTRDIAHRLQVNNNEAEAIKLNIQEDDDAVRDTTEARYGQIFRLIDKSLAKEGLRSRVGRGVVLCGGAAKYPEIGDVVERYMGMPSRIGKLMQDSAVGMNHDWLSAVGLIYYIQKQDNKQFIGGNNPCRKAFKMLQRWLEVYF